MSVTDGAWRLMQVESVSGVQIRELQGAARSLVEHGDIVDDIARTIGEVQALTVRVRALRRRVEALGSTSAAYKP